GPLLAPQSWILDPQTPLRFTSCTLAGGPLIAICPRSRCLHSRRLLSGRLKSISLRRPVVDRMANTPQALHPSFSPIEAFFILLLILDWLWPTHDGRHYP
ncbi:hypothetical protein PanWU01x14_012130, partial [Parasponia andersonii]